MPTLRPLGNRLIISPDKRYDRISASGLYLSNSKAYEKTEELHGWVLEVGPECKVIKKGDYVSFPAYGYDSVTFNDGSTDDFMSVREQEVLAVIEGRDADAIAKAQSAVAAPVNLSGEEPKYVEKNASGIITGM